MTRDHAIRLLRPFGLEEVGPDRAFKRAAMRYHPDKGGSAVLFRRIVEARDLLLAGEAFHTQARGREERGPQFRGDPFYNFHAQAQAIYQAHHDFRTDYDKLIEALFKHIDIKT